MARETLAIAGEAASTAGFVKITASDIERLNARLMSIMERLSNLGGRLIGPEQLPSRNRPEPSDAKTEPVLCETQQVTQALQRQGLALDEVEELVEFLQQL